MKRSNISCFFVISAFFCADLAAAPQLNQQSIDDLLSLSLEELLEIKVNVEIASLVEESKLDVGSSVWSIQENEWNRQNAKTLVDTMKYSPGTYSMDVFGTLITSFRGFAHQESARDSVTLFDGVPVNSYSFQGAGQAFSLLDLGILEKVEVIRGPGSSIYGASASHGVISLKTWSPENNATEIHTEGGSWGYRRFVGRIHRKTGSDKSFTFIVAGNKNDDQNVPYEYTDISTNTIESNGFEKINKVASIYTKVKSAGNEFSFLLNKWNRDGVPASFGRTPAENGGQYRARAETALLKVSRKWILPSEFYIDSFIAHQQQEYESFSPLFAGKPSSAKPTNVIDAKENHTSINITVKRPQTNSLPTQLAFGYLGNHYHINELSRYASTSATYERGGASGLDRMIHSIFLQTKTYFFNDRFNVLIGGRIDKYSDFGHHISPRAGLILHPTNDSALKLLYGHAFRASSGLEQGGLANILVPAGNDLDPEIVNTYEASFLIERKKLSFELTAFYSKMQDNVSVLPNTGPEPEPFVYENALEANSKGIELDGKWSPVDFIRFDISGSLVKSESDKPNQFRAYPKRILHWGINYFFLNNRASISVYNTHYADMESSDGRETKLSAYWNTDINAQYHLSQYWGKPQIKLNIGNVFDREGITSISSTTENGQPQTPFNISLGVQFSI